MKRNRWSAMAGVVVLGLSGEVTRANLVLNGSFETGTCGRYYPGSTGIPSWTISKASGAGSIDFTGPGEGPFWTSFDAAGSPLLTAKSIDLDGNSGDSGAISQSIQTLAGGPYELTFRLGGNFYNNVLTPRPLEVDWAGSAVASLTYSLHPGDTKTSFTWDAITLDVTGTGGMDQLMFKSTSGGAGYGAVVDLVSLNIVPEPGGMMGWLWTVGAAVLRRWR